MAGGGVPSTMRVALGRISPGLSQRLGQGGLVCGRCIDVEGWRVANALARGADATCVHRDPLRVRWALRGGLRASKDSGAVT